MDSRNIPDPADKLFSFPPPGYKDSAGVHYFVVKRTHLGYKNVAIYAQ